MIKNKEYNILDDLKDMQLELADYSDNLDNIYMYVSIDGATTKISIQELYNYIRVVAEAGLQAIEDKDIDTANMYFDIIKGIRLS